MFTPRIGNPFSWKGDLRLKSNLKRSLCTSPSDPIEYPDMPKEKPATKIEIEGRFDLELGGYLDKLEITYEEWGDERNPCVMVIPALSMGSHLRSSTSDPLPGWWEGMVGEKKAIDTNRYRVICPSILGAPFGTTSPISINPSTGKIYGPEFPQITTRDQARVHKKLLDKLKIQKLHAVVGSSLGGMQALSFANTFPDSVERLAAICTTGKSSPGTVAFRRVQRRAIYSDPKFQGGYYTGHGPEDGLAIARELGTILYRSREEFDARFGWDADPPYGPTNTSFPVEKYLEAQATRFSKRYDANCYLLLSKTMDLHDVGRGYPSFDAGVKQIRAKSLILAFEQDTLIPWKESRNLSRILQVNGRTVNFEISPSIFGHDSFLKEFSWLTPRLKDLLE